MLKLDTRERSGKYTLSSHIHERNPLLFKVIETSCEIIFGFKDALRKEQNKTELYLISSNPKEIRKWVKKKDCLILNNLCFCKLIFLIQSVMVNFTLSFFFLISHL